MPLQLRRGLQAERDSLVTDQVELLPGEPLWCTDTGNLYIGVAATVGGVHVNAPPVIDLADYTGTIGGGLEPFINADTTTIDLENNITTDIIPRTDLAYDLGSSTRKFNKIWLGTDGIAIGDTLITTNLAGTVIALPSGSTVGGQLISTFPGFEDGDDLKVNIVGEDDQLLLDYQNRLLIGDVTGNVTGNVTGDLLSTNIVTTQINSFFNANSGPGSRLSFLKSRGTRGTPTTVINGDEIGRIDFVAHTGDDYYRNASISSSVLNVGTVSTGVVPTGLNFSVMSQTGRFGINMLLRTGFTEESTVLGLVRINGTATSPTTVINGDNLGSFSYIAFDGVAFRESGFIRARITGPVSTGVVPTSILFNQMDSTGIVRNPLTINEDSSLSINRYTYNDELITIDQIHDTASSASINFQRSRGTSSSPAVVQSNDELLKVAIKGYNGTAQVDSIVITSPVESVSGSDIMSNLTVQMHDGTSLATKFIVENNGIIDFKQEVLVAGAGSGEVDTSVVAEYMRVKLNGVEYALPLYNINP
jgi:hypothetical protein